MEIKTCEEYVLAKLDAAENAYDTLLDKFYSNNKEYFDLLAENRDLKHYVKILIKNMYYYNTEHCVLTAPIAKESEAYKALSEILKIIYE